MRHRLSGRKLNRNSSHRSAMFRNMTASLVEHEIIKTTLAKAKELRMVAEPLITLAKQDNVANRRLASAVPATRQRWENCSMSWGRAMLTALGVISAYSNAVSGRETRHPWHGWNWWIARMMVPRIKIAPKLLSLSRVF